MTMIGTARIDSGIGELTVGVSERGVCAVRFGRAGWPPAAAPAVGAPAERRGAELLGRAVEQLEEYLAGRRRAFDLPLDLSGVTEFRREVLVALCDVGYGESISYGALAAAVGRPRAARAVGGACNANPVPVIVPCHRVIAADGGLGGYGAGLGVKRELLALEGGTASGGRAPAA